MTCGGFLQGLDMINCRGFLQELQQNMTWRGFLQEILKIMITFLCFCKSYKWNMTCVWRLKELHMEYELLRVSPVKDDFWMVSARPTERI